ncbi:MAG: hypothetical protein R2701_05720 [Acidimicrobiales bacterium]
MADLAARYPGDPTAVAPLLLELVHLVPGQAVHLPAGNLHAYLLGAGSRSWPHPTTCSAGASP